MAWLDKALKEAANSKANYVTETGNSIGRDWIKDSQRDISFIRIDGKTDAIAPVRTDITNRMTVGAPTYFQKGSDSVAKRILGSAVDVLENLGTGGLGNIENFFDSAAYIAPLAQYGQFLENGGIYTLAQLEEQEKKKEAAQKTHAELIKKDLIDEEKISKAIITNPLNNLFGIDAETDSVFGEKMDANVQSLGALIARIGVGKLGINGDLLMGMTSFGAEAENAFKNGASYEEAAVSGAVSAAGEVLSEKLSGGIKFGDKAMDEVLASQIARQIPNKILRTVAKLGLDVAGEGTEEIVSGVIGALGQKLTYADDKELKELFNQEDAWDAFVGGVLMGGVVGVTNAARTSKKGDYASGLSNNEQQVVEKLYKDKLASREKEGKVSQKEKSEIYDSILEDMEKGYISVDTIEEVLGGEKYNQYKKAAEWEDSLQSEFDTLNKMKQGDMTGEQVDRREALRSQLKNVKSTSTLEQQRTQIRDEVMNLVKGDRLAESYNERANTGKAFEADVTQYDTKQQAVVQKAIDSGILNNSRRTHEFVDFVSKISADTGVLFDFSNTAKIREAGFAVEGQTVDGFITKDGITVNIDSPKSRQFVVGHEITHAMEGTELYDALRQSVFDYAKMKNQYGVRMESIQKRYKEGTDFEAELTADLVGEYIFSDTDFVKNLSVQNRNVFQKVFDEIKYLCKVATSGSKEARELEKVKRAFEKAYREGGKTQGETKYSVSETTDGRFVAVVDNDILSNIDTSSWDDTKKAEAKKAASEALKQFSDGIVVDGITRKVNRVTRREYTRSNYTEGLYNNAPDIFADKMRAADIADDIVIAATNWNRDGGLKHPRTDNFVDFDLGNTLIVSGTSKYSAEVVVGITDTGEAVLYDVVYMTPATFDIKKEESPTTATTQNAIGDIQGDSLTDKVAQKGNNVKYPMSDSNGKQLTKEQQIYFKDSKVRNENGNLKVMYHGTPNGDFTIFNDGTYFTDSKEYAGIYQNPSASSISTGKVASVPKTFEVYLDIKKPFDINDTEARNIYINDYIKGGNAIGINPYLSDAEYMKINSIDWTEGEDLREFLIENEYDYDGLVLDEGGTGGYGDEVQSRGKSYVVFSPEQVKNVDNLKPSADPDIQRSLSNVGEQHTSDSLSALRLDAPVAENSTVQEKTQLPEENSTVTDADMRNLFPDDLTPVQAELEDLISERDQIYTALEDAVNVGSANDVGRLAAEYEEINTRIRELESEESERTGSLTDADAPPEMDAPFYGEESEQAVPDDPFYDRDIKEVGKQSVKAYQYENPEVKPFFQESALGMLYDVRNTTKGEKWYNDELYYSTGGEQGFGGTKRATTDDIAELKDVYGYTYDQIEKGLNAIIEDDGKENNAVSKRIEFMLNDRLLNGYTDVDGRTYEPNQDYIRLLNEKQVTEYSKEAFDSFMANADAYAPPAEDIAPVKPLKQATADTMDAPIFESKDKNAVKGQTTMFEPPKPNPKVANVLTEESAIAKEKSGIGTKLVSALVDKGMVFENLSLKTGNHELQAKWNYTLPSNTEARAQHFMENGAKGVKPLKDIKKTVDKSGKADDFFSYLYHVHNIDRMTLEDRFGVENKTVFGETVTADVSRHKVAQYEKKNPEFKSWANDVYAYNRHLRQLLVKGNVISQETANLWEKMYPHYVPIRRVDSKGNNISVPLDTNKTGVNNPVKRATGGNSDIQPVFSTMAQRTEQTYRAIARNAFGIELKNTLGTTINSQENTTGVDEAVDTLVAQEDHLLKPGTMTSNPTFTVFENGEKVEFEITEDMFDALKPAGKLLGHRSKAVTWVSEGRRNLLTTWNPVFALYRNPIKDLQDVGVNSQHPVKTYANVPNAIYQIATGGKWATEYAENGGKSNTYFDSRSNKFKAEDSVFKKTIGMPLKALENAGEFIEEIPRLAEYIASRQDGRSVERSMLDAARVTTNFAAGGDFTKFLNSHGFTFLNASVQGASQHVRNFREAKQQGLKGYVKVLAKYTVAGLPGILLNNLLWDDDEEYEELNDYVKQNYYVVAKTQDGKFIRIPKGRTAAVMQNAMEQMEHLVTGDDEADFSTFYELFMNNIAPNNPIENNILAPIWQAKNNEAWYGGDLVPSRLQKLPAEEQFDESTDSISKWLGEKTGASPYKINYLIDQYSGGLGDVFLPMMTPEAESGDNTFVGNMLAPWKKEISTDSVLNNKNPGNFYELKDELEVVSNGKNATEEDKMKSQYLDSVSWEMGDLYAQKREIQNSDLPDDRKYEMVREIQEQINELANNALDKYNHVRINGAYSEAGDRRFNYDAEKDKWCEIKPKNADGSDNWYYIQEQLSHDKLGMSYDDFWNGKEPSAANQTYYGEYNGKRYNYDTENKTWYEITPKNDDGSDNWYYQKEQEVTKGLGISYEEYWNHREEYNFAYDKPGQYAISQAIGGYDSYKEHYEALNNWQSDSYISADKDSNGNSISGTRKKKVKDYINGLDLDDGEKMIIYRSVYSSKSDKRAYNMKIIDYLNSRDDISYSEMKSILEELDMKVDEKGYITW